jgi:hypothetical protein
VSSRRRLKMFLCRWCVSPDFICMNEVFRLQHTKLNDNGKVLLHLERRRLRLRILGARKLRQFIMATFNAMLSSFVRRKVDFFPNKSQRTCGVVWQILADADLGRAAVASTLRQCLMPEAVFFQHVHI